MEKILLFPNSILRKKAEIVKKITLADLEIAERMIKIMLRAPGVGLAANQIGILKQIVTVHLHNEVKDNDKIYTLFNPRVISYSEKKK